jgi:hypothetical protein
MLYCVVYISKVVNLMHDGDLIGLLQQSRSYNETHGITGMLLYIEGRFFTKSEGRFMQVLEGTEDEVKLVFDKIKADGRHHQVIMLKKETITARHFNAWTMGFRSMQLEEYRNLTGFFELNDDFLKSYEFKESDNAYTLLKSFYDINKVYDFL